jgi:hypothetical protein
MKKFLKIIQDSDFATGILLLIIASFSYGGVDEGIWDGYGYIDWVFPIMSSFYYLQYLLYIYLLE